MVKQKQLLDELVDPVEALNFMSAALLETHKIEYPSFFEFVRDVWAYSYDAPDLFNTWHVQYLCDQVQRDIDDRKYTCILLPRGHFKSTVFGHAFTVWRLLSNEGMESDLLYLSFSDGMSKSHVGIIKNKIERNEVLSQYLKDLSPQAQTTFRYQVGGSKFLTVHHGGMMTFKRGRHVNAGMVVDDVLKDITDPTDLTQIIRIKERFETETLLIANVPDRFVPVMLIGTPMAPEDLLYKAGEDDRFNFYALPAFDTISPMNYPTPDGVLAPDIASKEQLEKERAANPRAFASERMLQPYLTAEAFLSRKDLEAVEDPDLRKLSATTPGEFYSELTVAGFDIGKKRHPSHMAVYRTDEEGKMIQIYQEFLDGVSYSDQVDYMNLIAENFDVDYGFFDNTQPVLEDRQDLNRVWEPIIFNQKNRRQMATQFERYVLEKRIRMLADNRQRDQIAVVGTDLKAPETRLGHADSFWSNAMACTAHAEKNKRSAAVVADLSSYASGAGAPSADVVREMVARAGIDACPQCGMAAGWVPGNQLCLICNYRGIKRQGDRY